MNNEINRPAKILVVDNDPLIHYLIKEILELKGYLTDFAESGIKALEMVTSQEFDLVLLDVMMPGMDGFEVCRRLQANSETADIPVIFLSGKDDEQSYIKGFELGAIDYLTKPINQLDLTLRIRNYLKLSWNEKRLKESELRYKRIVEDQTEYIFRLLPDGRISFVNHALNVFLGNADGELDGMMISQILKGEGDEEVMDQLKELNPELPVHTVRRKVICQDGTEGWQQWVDRAIFNDQGQVIEYQCVGRDVTIQKRYEESVRILTEEAAGVTGRVFFNVLLSNMVSLFNVHCAILAKPDKEIPEKINVIEIVHSVTGMEDIVDFKIGPGDSNKLKEKGVLFRNEDECRNHEFVIDMHGYHFPYYFGILLPGNEEESSGILFLTSATAFQVDSTILNILKMFSVRTATELEREMDHQKLREGELKYRMLANYNYDWEYWISPKGKFLYVSPSCERITGYTREEFLEKPDLFLEITHPDYVDNMRKHMEEDNRDNRTSENFEYKIIDKKGNTKWVNHYCSPVFDDEGNFQGIRGNNSEITERKQMEQALAESERKFRNIFHSSIDSIVISDFNNRILESNQAFQRIIGYSTEFIENKNILDFIYKPDRDIYIRWMHRIVAGDNESNPVEIRLVDSNKKQIYVEIKSRTLEYPGTTSIISILRDITERKEVQLKILGTIIETEEKERRRFSQDLHDGMGPLLSTIKLYTKSILTAKDQKNKQIAVEKSLEIVDEAISGIKNIANNISPSILTDFGLVVAVKSFVNKFNDTKKININFHSEIKQRFRPNIESSLFRIVIELINNTLKHAQANNILININHEGDQLILEYSDDGVGFDLNAVMKMSKGQGIFNIMNRINSLRGDAVIDTEINKGFNIKIRVATEEDKIS